MGQNEINQMKQALIKRGKATYKIDRKNEAELRRICNVELSLSLTGELTGDLDSFRERYNFNMIYTLPDKNKIKVAKVGTSTLKSGRKIEAFVDAAGNQYFQYRASNGTILKEDYFCKKENIGSDEYFEFKNDSIYKKSNMKELQNLFKPLQSTNKKLIETIAEKQSKPDIKTKEYEVLVEKIYNALNNKQMLEELLNENIDKFDNISYKYSEKYNKNLIDDILNCKNLDKKSKE